VLVDRWDVRRTMLVDDTLQAFAFALMLAAATLPGGAWLVIGLAFVAVAVAAGIFFETALAVAVQDSLDPENLVGGNARLELSTQVGLLGRAQSHRRRDRADRCGEMPLAQCRD
jgi:uncharacterized protein (DUF58 family)